MVKTIIKMTKTVLLFDTKRPIIEKRSPKELIKLIFFDIKKENIIKRIDNPKNSPTDSALT